MAVDDYDDSLNPYDAGYNPFVFASALGGTPRGQPKNYQRPQYSRPFDPLLKEIDEKLNALPAGPSPEEIEKRRASNSRNYRLGMAALLSGDPALQAAGGMVFKQALGQREAKVNERGSYDPITGAFTPDPERRREDLRDQRNRIRLADVQAGLKFEQDVRDDETKREMLGLRGEQQRAMRNMFNQTRPVNYQYVGRDEASGLPIVFNPRTKAFEYGVTDPGANVPPPPVVPQPGGGALPNAVAGAGAPNMPRPGPVPQPAAASAPGAPGGPLKMTVGPKPSSTGNATTEERVAAGYASRMTAATALLNRFERSGAPTETTVSLGAVPMVGQYARRRAETADQQRYRQAAEDWIRAKLRKESGAVIGKEEMAQEFITYFPQPGDEPELIEQKRNARVVATQAMIAAAGRAMVGQKAPGPLDDLLPQKAPGP